MLGMTIGMLAPKMANMVSRIDGAKGALKIAGARMNGILLDAQAFLETGVEWGSAIVSASGAVLLIVGLGDYSEGKTQHNPNAKMEGLSKIIGGIAVILIGIVLVPQIRSMFPE